MPLLTGELTVTLKGVGHLGELKFTDNSSWIRSRKFRLGVRVVPGQLKGIHIQECKTEAFAVKDHRGEHYRKHYPLASEDEVWRLDKIAKNGVFHKKLHECGIDTAEAFCRNFIIDRQKLRSILGQSALNKIWDALLDHAKTCTLNGKLYVYYAENVGVIFNNIYEPMDLSCNGEYVAANNLSEDAKMYLDKLVKAAYENLQDVTKYDKLLLECAYDHSNSNICSEIVSIKNLPSSSGLMEQPLVSTDPISVPQSKSHANNFPAVADPMKIQHSSYGDDWYQRNHTTHTSTREVVVDVHSLHLENSNGFPGDFAAEPSWAMLIVRHLLCLLTGTVC